MTQKALLVINRKFSHKQRDEGGPVVNRDGVQFGIIPMAPAYKGHFCLSDTTNEFISILPFLDWIFHTIASSIEP